MSLGQMAGAMLEVKLELSELNAGVKDFMKPKLGKQ